MLAAGGYRGPVTKTGGCRVGVQVVLSSGLFGMLLTGCGPSPAPAVASDPGPPPRIFAGGAKTCVVLAETKLRCWGRNDDGRLGFGLPQANYGDDEPASAVPLLNLGHTIAGVSLRTSIACLNLENNDVRCWGGGAVGALGFPWDGWLGDDETLLDGPTVDFGGDRVIQVVAGSAHGCALLDGGTVKCWGHGGEGATGYGSTTNLADDEGESPNELPTVDIGGPARSLAAGSDQTCAVMQDGGVRCWGDNGFGILGLGVAEENVGDDESPASFAPIQLAGGPVVQVAAQGRQICALHQEGTVSCWGETGPWLGYGKAMAAVGEALGDDEHPSVLGVVDVGGKVVEIVVGDAFTCARLEDGAVKCWGASNVGQLGYGNTNFVGYHETPAQVGPLDLGGPATSIVAGWEHACALLADSLRCWGAGPRLGYGSPENVGDDETPAQAGPVPFR